MRAIIKARLIIDDFLGKPLIGGYLLKGPSELLMTSSDRDRWVEQYRSLQELLCGVLAGPSREQFNIAALRSQLSYSDINEGSQSLRHLFDTVVSRLEYSASICDRNREAFFEAVEALRMQMLASVLAAREGVAAVENGDSELIKSRDSITTIVHSSCGVISATLGSDMVLMLPREVTGSKDELLTELHDIFERTSPNHGWIVDFSGVDFVPIEFFGWLMIYENRLRFRQATLAVTFLKPQLVPDSWKARVERIFELDLVGGQYFSRRASV